MFSLQNIRDLDINEHYPLFHNELFQLFHYFIKPMMEIGGANENALKSYAAVQFIAAIVDLALCLVLVIVPNKIQSLLKKTRGY